LASHAARFIAGRISAVSGRFALSLSGGTTPKPVYELLGANNRSHSGLAESPSVLGDERFLPHDRRLSNFRMAREALIDRAPIPAA